jgi:hypothetical protein
MQVTASGLEVNEEAAGDKRAANAEAGMQDAGDVGEWIGVDSGARVRISYFMLGPLIKTYQQGTFLPRRGSYLAPVCPSGTVWETCSPNFASCNNKGPTTWGLGVRCRKSLT